MGRKPIPVTSFLETVDEQLSGRFDAIQTTSAQRERPADLPNTAYATSRMPPTTAAPPARPAPAASPYKPKRRARYTKLWSAKISQDLNEALDAIGRELLATQGYDPAADDGSLPRRETLEYLVDLYHRQKVTEAAEEN